MIDPIQSLAFSIQANRGVYAVLLGSGVSRAAKIPTGWEITLDLVRKLATLQDDKVGADPEAWYREKFGKDPDYSDLLENIAKTQAERQQLLREYWEPNEQEREEGDKQPTVAHRAIATLVARGFIKVIITTNFDRLMEKALRDAGIEPTVLSSPDDVQGALPLVHTPCCVFKLHGDYLDTRILNTPVELETYPEEFDKLLNRIFDEFGLIVCGWSADWDMGLRNAMCRAPSRRFTTYWAVRGAPSDAAQRLINHRSAEVIAIENADNFFQTIEQHVQSIEEFSRPRPLSTEAAVATLKRYLSESKYQIQLSDFVNETVERVIETVLDKAFTRDYIHPNSKSVTKRVRDYDAACSTLLPMALIGSYWEKKEHFDVWRRALVRLSEVEVPIGVPLLELKRYPATLLLYALGLSALVNNRLDFLEYLLTTPYMSNREDTSVAKILPPFCLSSRIGISSRDLGQYIEGMERRYAPLNEWLHDELRPHAKRLIPNDDTYTLLFDKLEILIALSYAFQNAEIDEQQQWIPMGAFAYRHENRARVLQEIETSISDFKKKSPFVKSGVFGKTVKNCEQSLDVFKRSVGKINRY